MHVTAAVALRGRIEKRTQTKIAAGAAIDGYLAQNVGLSLHSDITRLYAESAKVAVCIIIFVQESHDRKANAVEAN